MKRIYLSFVAILIFSMNSFAQKAENMNEILQNKNLYSQVVAKEIAKNVGTSTETENKITQIYDTYLLQLRTERKSNPSITPDRIKALEAEREQKIKSNLSEKEKYNKYLLSKNTQK